jgi:hypothetical protein
VFVQHLLEIIARAWVPRFDFRREKSIFGPSFRSYVETVRSGPICSLQNLTIADDRSGGAARRIVDAIHISGPLGAIDCEKRAEKRAKASGIEVKKNWTSRAPYWSCGNETKGHSSQPQERPSGEFCGQKNWRKEG